MELQPVIDVLVEFAQKLLVMALPVLAAYGVKKGRELVDAKLAELKAQAAQVEDARVRWALETAVGYGVNAVERTVEGGLAKKQVAVAFVQRYLDSRGVHLDVGLIAEAVEAEVFKQFNVNKGPLPPTKKVH